LLRQFQSQVVELRTLYDESKTKKDYTQVDFSDENKRLAYLLAYYPISIEPIYMTLTRCGLSDYFKNIKTSYPEVCFIGGGPLAELLGLLAFFADNQIVPITLNVYNFDKYNKNWVSEVTQITRPLMKQYHSSCNVFIRSFGCDFCHCSDPFLADEAVSINSAQLIVMQNCLNDFIKDKNSFINNFSKMVDLVHEGSLLVLLDLEDYGKIQKLLDEICQSIIKVKGGIVIKKDLCKRKENKKANFKQPEILNVLFEKSQNIWVREYIYYQSVVIKKL